MTIDLYGGGRAVDDRALDLVRLGASLQEEAKTLTADVNVSYRLVHEVLSEAMIGHPARPADIGVLRRNLRAKLRVMRPDLDDDEFD
ncbi:hypothetical protein [Caulobacter sp. 17J65-9]|uniref:hypothetical protein n=1 Tax=Caulobacter sp. 17J65-9 TaxID=2709382 RepID=UPI0013CA7304|nr:hypothetical protein [Caulobacter sp. 17J65-9]NEX92129.1 hypothetical protein [Caulobacter sp. 17J65-9]